MMPTAQAVQAAQQVKRQVTLVDLLTWAYRDQLVDRMSARSLEWLEAEIDDPDWSPNGCSADGCAAVERIGTLGTRIDGGGGAWGGSTRCHPDAEAVHDAVLTLGGRWRHGAILLMRYGRLGERPERSTATPTPMPTTPDRQADRSAWATIAGRRVAVKLVVAERTVVSEPIYSRRGRRMVQTASRLVKAEVVYCPITWYPHLSWIEAVNEEADRWEEAVAKLAALLRQPLRDHRIVGLGISS